eukprot:gene11636-15586_t
METLPPKRNSILSPLNRFLRYFGAGALGLGLFPRLIRNSRASGGIPSAAMKTNISPFQGMLLWLVLFVISATMHSAESAITKISPWKLQEFVEEEGPNSPFATLSNDITRLLITILLTTTACSIYSTALFVATISEIFPNLSLGFVTVALTAITLFFGELIPKAIAVSNSELVARKLVPFINRLATLLYPFTMTITTLSDIVLSWSGLRSKEDRNVSEDMLRMVVDEAERTESIESGEGQMIKAVLDIQDKEVSKIMQPRVEIVALSETASATQILEEIKKTKYSRLPVFRGDVDNIVGVVFGKDLLDYMSVHQVEINGSDVSKIDGIYRPKMDTCWNTLTAGDLMKPTYFIPETMSCWTALQEMRKTRLHMAIVVDEYGGTAGLITFEDILEEVVGEIYDEDDYDEQADDSKTIFKRLENISVVNGDEINGESTANINGDYQNNNKNNNLINTNNINSQVVVYEMKGYAELDDVFETLQIEIKDDERDSIDEYATIGGLLCSIAGMIPKKNDQIEFAGYVFTINEVEDNRRITSLIATPKLESMVVSGNGNGATAEIDSI